MIVFGSASLGSVVSSVSLRPYINNLPRGDASDDVIEERRDVLWIPYFGVILRVANNPRIVNHLATVLRCARAKKIVILHSTESFGLRTHSDVREALWSAPNAKAFGDNCPPVAESGPVKGHRR